MPCPVASVDSALPSLAMRIPTSFIVVVSYVVKYALTE